MKITILSFFLLVWCTGYGQRQETREVGTFTRISYGVPGKLILRQGSPQKVELSGDEDVIRRVTTRLDGNRLVIEDKNNSWNWNDDEVTVRITVAELEGLQVSGSGDATGEGKFNVKDDLSLWLSGSGSLKIAADVNGDLEANVSGSGDMSVSGTCRKLKAAVSGSGDLQITSQVNGDANLNVSGSGKIAVQGKATNVEATITGSGRILAADLTTNICEVRISGSGDVEITVNNELNANITGSGSVAYRGSPSKVNSHSSGSGKVRKM